MSKRKFRPRAKQLTLEQRIALANAGLVALCNKYHLGIVIEHGHNSAVGQFQRIVFVERPPAPPAAKG